MNLTDLSEYLLAAIDERQGVEGIPASDVAVPLPAGDALTLDLGPSELTVSNAQAIFEQAADGSAQVEFSGGLILSDNLKLSVNCRMPGDFMLRGSLSEVSLTELVGDFTNQAISLPNGFDLTLTEASVLIRETATGTVLQLAATIEGKGRAVFEARRLSPVQNIWGFAVCADLSDIGLSSLPGLETLEIFEGVFRLSDLLMIVSSFDDPAFNFPSLADFNNPSVGTDQLKLPPQSGGVIQGLNVFAQWMPDAGSQQQKLLKEFLHIDELGLSIILQIGANPARDSRFSASIDTTIEGHSFSGLLGAQVKDNQAGLFLTGKLKTVIQEQPVEFDATLLFVAAGALVSGSMIGTISFAGLKLSNLALVIGINWEGVPSLGIAATLMVKGFQSSLAVFFDSTFPSRSMLAGAVSDLSLKDVLDAFAGDVDRSDVDELLSVVKLIGTSAFTIGAELADALDNLQIETVSAAFAANRISLPASLSQVLIVAGEPGKSWALTDLKQMLHYELTTNSEGNINVVLNPQFYCVPQATSIGALRFEQGIFINTGLAILSFDAMAKISVNPNKGISLDGEMERIVIGTESFFSFSADDKEKGPRISVATYSQPEMPEEELRAPHILIDGQLNILGLMRQAYAKLTRDGFEFRVGFSPLPMTTYELEGSFGGDAGLRVGGNAEIGVGTLDLGALGSIEIETKAIVKLSAGAVDSEAWAKFEGNFKFAGKEFNLPPFDLDVNSASLLELPDILRALITENLKKQLLENPEKWLKLVNDGIVKGIENTANVLKTTFDVSVEQAGQLLKKVGCASDEMMKMLSDAGYAREEIKGFFGDAEDKIKGKVSKIGDLLS